MNIAQKILTALFLLLFGATLFVFYYQASSMGLLRLGWHKGKMASHWPCFTPLFFSS